MPNTALSRVRSAFFRAALLYGALIPSTARAHIAPLHPVDVSIRFDGASLEAVVESNAAFWILEVFHQRTPPSTDWPPEIGESAARYLEERLVFKADGAVLPARVVSHRYVQEPWQDGQSAAVRLTVACPVPKGAAVLNVESRLFFEEMKDHPGRKGIPEGWPWTFETRVRFPEAGAASFSLSPDRPSESIAFSRILPTLQRRMAGAAQRGLSFSFGSLAFLLVAVLAGVFLSGALRATWFLAGVFFAGGFFGLFRPVHGLEWAAPALFAIACLSSGRPAAGKAALAASAAFLGSAMFARLSPLSAATAIPAWASASAVWCAVFFASSSCERLLRRRMASFYEHSVVDARLSLARAVLVWSALALSAANLFRAR